MSEFLAWVAVLSFVVYIVAAVWLVLAVAG